MKTREIRFEYGFDSVNGIVKKHYYLHDIPNIKDKCDVWNLLPIVYVRQYTGLKDKNGKEIYEGDIFQYELTEHNEDATIYIEEVHFIQGSFELDNCPLGAFNNCGVVIGNIHTNPELLTK